MKIVVTLVLCALLVVGWFSLAGELIGTTAEYNGYLSSAESSLDKGLYEQAVEYYEKALEMREDELSLYTSIKDAYKAYYEEQGTVTARSKYIKALIRCCEANETEPLFYEEIVRIYYDAGEYSKANKYAYQALNNGAANAYVMSVGKAIKYMHSVSLVSFDSYQHTLRGKYTVSSSDGYWIADTTGKALSATYAFAGALSAKGTAIYRDTAGFSVRDGKEVVRLRLAQEIEACGYYADGLIPVKIGGAYVYLNESGTDSGIGSFTYATSMSDGRAAVVQNGKWGILQKDGTLAVGCRFDEIALDMYGRYFGGNFYAAREGNTFTLYDKKDMPLDLTCADIDIATDAELFAFQDAASGKWGFADKSGNVKIKPAYAEAKGFSNGYAAVKNADGRWGFITEANELVIDYTYTYAGYFESDETCIVASAENRYGILKFKYR